MFCLRPFSFSGFPEYDEPVPVLIQAVGDEHHASRIVYDRPFAYFGRSLFLSEDSSAKLGIKDERKLVPIPADDLVSTSLDEES